MVFNYDPNLDVGSLSLKRERLDSSKIKNQRLFFSVSLFPN